MRRSGSARLCAALAGLMIAQAPAGAAPLDFLFGGPPSASRGGMRQRHRAPRPPGPAADIPMPVPRPRFPGDPPRLADTPETPPAVEPEKPAEPAPAPPSAGPPLPPPRPPEIGKPAVSETKPVVTQVPAPAAAPPSQPPAPITQAVPPTPPPKPPEIAKPGEAPKPAEIAKPAETAKPGETAKPAPGRAAPPPVAPSGATTAFTPRSPDDDPACPSRLEVRAVAVEPVAIGPQPDARCVVVEAVRLSGLAMPDGSKVEFPDKPTIACTTADAFSLFVRDLMVPLSKGTFGTPIAAIWTGPGLECRSRDHIFGAKLSAHGQGLAIDIARLKLADGRMIEVGDPKTDLETGFETAARAGACGYFHTVLGPGSDAYHRTHWHFDLEVRGAHGDSKYCK